MESEKKLSGYEAGQMAAFLFGLARGETVTAAAKAAGLVERTLRWQRKRCAPLDACWRDAVAMARQADLEERRMARVQAAASRGTVVRRHSPTLLMRKRKFPVEFDRERKQTFLDHFAATCNFEESAAEAGISLSPVYRALKSDPAFRAGFEEALQIGYLCLEAEALREQREAQQAYRINPGDAVAKARSFERTMQLLREYKRAAGGKIGRSADRSHARWTFDETIEAIEKKLKAFGVDIPDLPAEDGPPPPGEGSPSGGPPVKDPGEGDA